MRYKNLKSEFLSLALTLMKHAIIIFLIMVLGCGVTHSEEFGKNKVRYKGFTWHILKTTHFDVYYNPQIEELAKIAAGFAESSYKKISDDFEYDVNRRIPFVLFGSQYDFEQTNIILELIDKGVGGFSEIFKFRMVIPYTGSYHDLKTVVTHELTHIFTYDLLYGDILTSIFSNQFISTPPLWFMEGIAEHETGQLDTTGEMVLSDATLENTLIPLSDLADFSRLSRVYLAYKESHSLINYISETYGDDKLRLLLRRFKGQYTSLDKVIKSSLGVNLAELEDRWMKNLRQKYYPYLSHKKYPSDYGNELPVSSVAVKPIWSPGGDLIAAIITETDHAEIVLIRECDGKIIKRITKGMYISKFEDITTEKKPLTWSSDGTNLAFIAKKGGKDWIFIWDILHSKLIDKIKIKEIDTITSISVEPNGDKFILSGISNGKESLYLFDYHTKKLSSLLADNTNLSSPVPSPNGNYIAFVKEERGGTNIFLLDIKSKEILPVTHNHGNNIDPSWSNDSRYIFFSSDATGAYNLYCIDTKASQIAQLTNILGGAFSPAYFGFGREDKQKLAFGVYSQSRYHIRIIDPLKIDNWQEIVKEEKVDKEGEAFELPKEEGEIDKYRTRFTMDMRQGNLLYDSSQGLRGNAVLITSDILGNHRFSLLTDSSVLLTNYFLEYHYLTKRPSYSIGIFNWKNYYINVDDEDIIENTYGVMTSFEYPFSKFRRLELSFLTERIITEYENSIQENKSEGVDVISLAFVQDTSSWSWHGPVSGQRSKFAVEQTVNLIYNDMDYTNYKIDIRKYISVSRESTLAIHLSGKVSTGNDPREFAMGGTPIFDFLTNYGTLRGYQYGEFWGNYLALTNIEFRIPFIKRVLFAFPPLALRDIRGVLFIDTGVVWSEENPIFWDETGRLDALKFGFGTGLRIVVGMFPCRLDWGWQTDFIDTPSTPKIDFSIGYDF